ncbi:MAG: aldehyde dehydrogenase family protein, partial [Flavobacteriales bacterium]|nr:aldehyde dehydrogenase family protein [Flavobacteriales bacterium]
MITGKNYIGFTTSAKGNDLVKNVAAHDGSSLSEDFYAATEQEIDEAVKKATHAFKVYSSMSGAKKANFLEEIAREIEMMGDTLIHRAALESGLTQGRFEGERARTTTQLRMFADLLREGSWVEAVIDTALPERAPVPRTDLRKMLTPLGPVVVFAASNFPLAFSTAGGDTASALAAGCPVIVKAHGSHLGVNDLVAGAINRAAKKTGMPDGVFSSLNGSGRKIGKALVLHQGVKAVAFTHTDYMIDEDDISHDNFYQRKQSLENNA